MHEDAAKPGSSNTTCQFCGLMDVAAVECVSKALPPASNAILGIGQPPQQALHAKLVVK